MHLFEAYKAEALLQRDILGENVLFECARSGNQNLFKYFMECSVYVKAREQKNFLGRTIEHIVCMSR